MSIGHKDMSIGHEHRTILYVVCLMATTKGKNDAGTKDVKCGGQVNFQIPQPGKASTLKQQC